MNRVYMYVIIFVLAILNAHPIQGQKNPALATSPPMGWNSWNWYGKKDINEQVVIETIDAIVKEGLKDAGYTYVIIDGGWRAKELSANGELQAHAEKFPNGIKFLSDYAHKKGLKIGLHVVPGTHDCGGDPVGSFGREEIHIQQFVDWELDMVKVDLCIQKEDPCEACLRTNSGWSEETIRETYIKWSRLLADAPRDILFSISAYQYRDWYPELCNMARTTGDIRCRIHGQAVFHSPEIQRKNFFTVMEIANSNNLSAKFAGNGYWNDPDMMVTGEQGLSHDEQVSHFALWCIMSAPLMLGNDPCNMTSFEHKLICNKEMIKINQDPYEQGRIIKQSEDWQIWAKHLMDGSIAVLILNLMQEDEQEITLNFSDIGIESPKLVRDLVEQKDMDLIERGLTVRNDPNECAFILISEKPQNCLSSEQN